MIASFAGGIRADFELTHGGFGLIYMLATLGSAATLVFIGSLVDDYTVVRAAGCLILLLAVAAVLMATAVQYRYYYWQSIFCDFLGKE